MESEQHTALVLQLQTDISLIEQDKLQLEKEFYDQTQSYIKRTLVSQSAATDSDECNLSSPSKLSDLQNDSPPSESEKTKKPKKVPEPNNFMEVTRLRESLLKQTQNLRGKLIDRTSQKLNTEPAIKMQTGKPDLEKTTVKKQELTAALKQMADGGIFYKQFG